MTTSSNEVRMQNGQTLEQVIGVLQLENEQLKNNKREQDRKIKWLDDVCVALEKKVQYLESRLPYVRVGHDVSQET